MEANSKNNKINKLILSLLYKFHDKRMLDISFLVFIVNCHKQWEKFLIDFHHSFYFEFIYV